MADRSERPRRRTSATPPVFSRAQLEALTEEAIVDAYGESEQAVAFATVLEDNVALPFTTEVLGVPVVVERIDTTERDEIVAVVRRGRHRQRVPLLDLPLPSPPPAGAEWIAAYRLWAGGGG